MRRTVEAHQAAVMELLATAWSARSVIGHSTAPLPAGTGPAGAVPAGSALSASGSRPGSRPGLPDGRGDGRGEKLPLAAALERVTLHDVVAPLSLPPFDNSQMDGFAVHSEDLSVPAELRVAATIAAGTVPPALPRGWAAPIMTGAALPPGADAVVPVEQAEPPAFPDQVPGGAPMVVTLPATPAGRFVRSAGSDVPQGTVAIPAGTRLAPAHLGLAAALGLAGLEVRTKPRVLLVATGDEVVLPGQQRPAGKIFDANTALLQANLAQAGVDVVPAGLVPDQPEALLTMLAAAVDDGGIDLIVTMGGISAGAFEVVRLALSGPDALFCSVALQPGGPQGLGLFQGVPFLAFPGNPVSSVVSFEMFLRPALTTLIGAPAFRPRIRATLTGPLASPAGKHQVRRAVYAPALPGQSGGVVSLAGGESSHLLGALAAANALVQVPADVTTLEAGGEVEVWLL
jgi:molybdopterin molybdotransferase